MSEKKYFAYLSFIWGLIVVIPILILLTIIFPNHIEDYAEIIFYLCLFVPTLIIFKRLCEGKYVYTMWDAIFNLYIFRNIPKAIELFKSTLEQIENTNPKLKTLIRIKTDNTGICYWELMVCYAKLRDNETAKEYLEKYLEFIPEKDREKIKNRLYKKYHLDEILPEESL